MSKKTDFTKLTLAEKVAHMQSLQAGSIHTLVYHKQISLASKWDGFVVETESVIQGRVKLDYGDQIKLVAQLHANGMGYGELKGFKAEIEDLLYSNLKDGRMAFRVFPINGGKHSKRYFLNGVETTLEDLLAMGLPKSKLVGSGNPVPVLALYADNILSVD